MAQIRMPVPSVVTGEYEYTDMGAPRSRGPQSVENAR